MSQRLSPALLASLRGEGERIRFDTVVVGSGMGGMSSASLLTQLAGERVLLAEQHPLKIGGCTHEFEREGITFDVGLHYVGQNMDNVNAFSRQLMDLVTDGKVKWNKLDDVFDVATVEGETFPVEARLSRRKASLKRRFASPREAALIDAYFADIAKVSSRYGSLVLSHIASAYGVPETISRRALLDRSAFGAESTGEAFKRLGINLDSKLCKVLLYLYGDYTTQSPNRGLHASYVQHAMTVMHYAGGACFPSGGPSAIGKSVERVVVRGGGTIIYNATVTKIEEMDDGMSVTIQMTESPSPSDTVTVKCSKVISAMGAYNTFCTNVITPTSKLGSREKLRRYRALIVSSPNRIASPSHFTLFVRLRGGARELGLSKANFWFEDEKRFVFVFINFPSTKNDAWSHPNVSTCEVAVEVEDPARFLSMREGSEEYREAKRRMREEMMEVLLRRFPQLRDKVESVITSTPKTTARVLGSYNGCTYGLDCVESRYRLELEPTVVPNRLYLAGQDVLSCGILGAMMGGLVASTCASSRVAMQLFRKFYLARAFVIGRGGGSVARQPEVVRQGGRVSAKL